MPQQSSITKIPPEVLAGNKGLKYVATVTPGSTVPYNVYSSDSLRALTEYCTALAEEQVLSVNIYTRTHTLSSKLSVRKTKG
jgi:hypothetical protein